jgi:hypothetical protein
LDDYGVDQTTVDELQTHRDELEAQLGAPRNAIVERKTLTGQIRSLRREIDAILNLQLDKLMEFLREEHPGFFASYKNARVTIDQPATHSSSEVDPGEYPSEDPSEEESNFGGYGA